jgi:hypothetical protein
LEEDRLRIQEEKEIAKKLKGLSGEDLLEAKEEIFKQRQTRILEVRRVAVWLVLLCGYLSYLTLLSLFLFVDWH